MKIIARIRIDRTGRLKQAEGFPIFRRQLELVVACLLTDTAVTGLSG